MNITFNIFRFFNVLKKDLIEYRKTLLSLAIISAISMVVVALLVYLVPDYLDYTEINKTVFSLFLLYVMFSFSVMTARFMGYKLSRQEPKLSYLMLPASYLEKFMSVFFITLFIIPLTILCPLFLGYEFIFLTLKMGYEPGLLPINLNMFMNGLEISVLYFIIMFITTHNLFLFTSFIFRKSVFVKSVSIYILIIAIAYFICYFILGKPTQFNSTGNDSLESGWFSWVSMLVQIILVYVLSYMRFKETEIIESKI